MDSKWNTESTHSIQFCFPNEEAFENAFMSYGQSMDARLLLDERLREYAIDVSQLNQYANLV